MAFFKFRWPGQGEQQQAEKPSKRSRTPQAESIEVMRRRALWLQERIDDLF